MTGTGSSRRPVWATATLGGGRDQMLALANGRRTPRDIAFAAGRGVYAVTLQVARMLASGVLVVESTAGGQPGCPRSGAGRSGAARAGRGGQPGWRRGRGRGWPRARTAQPAAAA